MLKYYLDRYRTQKRCDKADGACLGALQCVPYCFVTSKMLEILDDVVLSSNDIDSDIVTFFSDDMGIIL